MTTSIEKTAKHTTALLQETERIRTALGDSIDLRLAAGHFKAGLEYIAQGKDLEARHRIFIGRTNLARGIHLAQLDTELTRPYYLAEFYGEEEAVRELLKICREVA